MTHGSFKLIFMIEKICQFIRKCKTEKNLYYTKLICYLSGIIIVIFVLILFAFWVSNLPLNVVNPIRIAPNELIIEPSEINEQILQGNFTIRTLVIKNNLGTDLYNVTLAQYPIQPDTENLQNNLYNVMFVNFNSKSFTLKSERNEYVFVNFSIPRNAPEGEYKSEIQIKGNYDLFYKKNIELVKVVPIKIIVHVSGDVNKTLQG